MSRNRKQRTWVLSCTFSCSPELSNIYNLPTSKLPPVLHIQAKQCWCEQRAPCSALQCQSRHPTQHRPRRQTALYSQFEVFMTWGFQASKSWVAHPAQHLILGIHVRLGVGSPAAKPRRRARPGRFAGSRGTDCLTGLLRNAKEPPISATMQGPRKCLSRAADPQHAVTMQSHYIILPNLTVTIAGTALQRDWEKPSRLGFPFQACEV